MNPDTKPNIEAATSPRGDDLSTTVAIVGILGILVAIVVILFDARNDHKYIRQQQVYEQQCRAHCGYRTAMLVNGGEGCLCLPPVTLKDRP